MPMIDGEYDMPNVVNKSDASLKSIENVGILITVLFIVSLIFVPILLNYSCNIDSDNIPFVWRVTDILQYIGTAAGAFGTVILGCCTLWINKRMQKLNEELNAVTMQMSLRESKEQMPLVDVVKLNFRDDEYKGNNKIKIRIIYDEKVNMYRVIIWIHHLFSYAIKSVMIKNAEFGLVDQNFRNKRIEMDENKKLEYSAEYSYVSSKALLPQQETVFSMYFDDTNNIKELSADKRILFFLVMEFENENNSGQKITEIINLSCRGAIGLDKSEFDLYSEEIFYEWIDS